MFLLLHQVTYGVSGPPRLEASYRRCLSSYLTLPLPITKTWRHVIHCVPWESIGPPLAAQVEVLKDSSYGYLKKLFGRWFHVDPENLLAVEIWSHKFYRFYDDYMNVTDLAEKNILVLYELPIPLKSAAKPSLNLNMANSPKRSPLPRFQPLNRHYTTRHLSFRVNQRGVHSAFGIPFLVVLTPVQACLREAIYRAVVERCERWTRLKSDLWRYRGAKVEEIRLDEPLDEVVDNVTEITPGTGEGFWAMDDDGLDVTVVPATSAPTTISLADVEMTDTSRSEIAGTLASSDVAPTISSEAAPTISSKSVQPAQTDDAISATQDDSDAFEVLGPQEDLFDLKIYNTGVASSMETGFNMNPTTARFVDWSKRESRVSDFESEDGEPATSPARPLIQATNALVCQWPPTMHNHFFSIENNLFDRWDSFIHPEVEVLRAAQTKSRSGRQAIDIEDCLSEFTKEEELGEGDLCYCPRCKKHQQATKKFELWSVPYILVVHLKRFLNIDALVDFPTEGLDLGPRVGMSGAEGEEATEGEYVYDLFAVDEHMGEPGGGHYRANAKNPSDGEYHVTKSSGEDSVNANAHLLFYRRRAAVPNAAIDKVRARIESSLPDDLESKSVVDMTAEPVIRAPSPDDADLPTFEASIFDALVPQSASTLRLSTDPKTLTTIHLRITTHLLLDPGRPD
ncbi:CSN-associated deubiquitinating enzyme Ubp12 [Ceratobasidium sp. 395]|nr:CSN-associated deubiquitinating enzyme Ubp12 [Ceratobasidium sp. 395]